MQRMHRGLRSSSRWALQLRLRAVLRQAGGVDEPRQAPGSGNAEGHRTVSGFPIPGGHLVLRRPDPDETPLSREEVAHARRIGVIA